MTQEPRVVTPGFHKRVYAVVRTVPSGRVVTYGDVASALGSPRVARHVGWALSALVNARTDGEVPWHRVVNQKGRISHRGQGGRAEEQIRRLEAEGVVFDADGVLQLKALRWTLSPPK